MQAKFYFIPCIIVLGACSGGKFHTAGIKSQVDENHSEAIAGEEAAGREASADAEPASSDPAANEPLIDEPSDAGIPEVVANEEEPQEQPNVDPMTPPADTGNVFKECNGDPALLFVADLYALEPQTKKLPDFASLTPIKKICMKQLDIAARRFSDGFPGVDALVEWFGLAIRAQIVIPVDGTYTFFMNSDDGSKLSIQNEVIIDNDGLHEPRELQGSKFLKAGTYPLRVDYYQGPRYQIALQLQWREPAATEKSYIPAAFLKRP